MPTITSRQTLERTKDMLVDEWKLKTRPPSTTPLRPRPPEGLGKNDNQIRALVPPINNAHFEDVEADVDGNDLIRAKTVGEVRDQIWETIPARNKAE